MIEYYDEKIECMPRDELKKLQLKLFNIQLKRAQNTKAYNGKLPEKIADLSEIKNLPFTTKDDLRRNFPYGFLAVDKEKIARFNATSGTTGIPTLAFFTKNDITKITERGVRHLVTAGLSEKNVVQSILGNGLFVGGWYYNNAALELGMSVLPTGTGNTKRQIELLKQLKADCVFTTSGYIQYFLNQLTDDDIAQLNLKKAVVGAEPLSRSFRKIALEKYGVEIYESSGMTEIGGPLSYECSFHNGLHVAEDDLYMEIIDPETGKTLPDGEYGELVITPLQQEAMPLIRYRTRDITRIIPDNCLCGRTHKRLDSYLRRLDDMTIVNGVNIYPSQVEECIYKHLSSATNYLIHIIESHGLKKMCIDIELSAEMLNDKESLSQLEENLTKTLKSYITVSPNLNFVPLGTLPEIQGKAKRLVNE